MSKKEGWGKEKFLEFYRQLMTVRRILYTTPVVLVVKHEVRAVVDLEGMIIEENEENNVVTKILGKEKLEPKTLLPDLTITDLFLNPRKKLAVTIANIGDSPLPLDGGNLKILVRWILKRKLYIKEPV